jgi:hypothetical protein
MIGSASVKLAVISITLAIAVSGACKDAAHPDHGVHRRGANRGPEQLVDERAKRGAGHRADKQRGREHAARASDREREAGGDHLADQEQQDEAEDDVAGDDRVHDWVADPVHLGQREEHQPEQDAADRRARPFRAPSPQLVGVVLHPVQHGLKADPDQSREDRQHGHQQVGGVIGHHQVVRDQREERRGAEERAADEVAGDRSEAGGEQGIE